MTRICLLFAGLALTTSACRSPQTQQTATGPEPDAHTVSPGTGPLETIERPGDARIDAHSHLIGVTAWPEIEHMLDEQSIDYIFNLSGGSPRRGMTQALQLSQMSGGRILNFMTVDWNGVDEVAFGETVANELELAVTEYGFAGLKISKALGLFVVDAYDELIPVDDPRLFPIWERAAELNVPVFIHTSDPAAFWLPITPENERFDELNAHPGWSFSDPIYPSRNELLAQRDHLLQLFPQTQFVGVHFANNPEDLDYVEHALETYPNLSVDISARIPEIGRHDPERVRALFERFSDRILFATDIVLADGPRGMHIALGSSGAVPDTVAQIPTFYERHYQWLETSDADIAHPTPIQGNWTVDAIGLSDEVLDAIYYENAYRLVVQPWLGRNHDGIAQGD